MTRPNWKVQQAHSMNDRIGLKQPPTTNTSAPDESTTDEPAIQTQAPEIRPLGRYHDHVVRRD